MIPHPYLVELAAPVLPLARGANGLGVRRVQEWLCLQAGRHYEVAIDLAFGPATEAAVAAFQRAHVIAGRGADGMVDRATWDALIAPLAKAEDVSAEGVRSFGRAAVRIARAHLEAHGREVGGPNRGPYPRHYTRGFEAAWCAGFANHCYFRAARDLAEDTPWSLVDEAGVPSLWVPWLVNSCKAAGLFHSGGSPGLVPPGSMFFVPGEIEGRPSHVHVGIVVADAGGSIETIEGNYADAVSTRFRPRASIDFGLCS